MKINFISIGFLMTLIGIAAIIIGIALKSFKAGRTKVEWGFGGFVWFIPFGFGSSKRMLYAIMALTLTIFALFLIFGRKLI